MSYTWKEILEKLMREREIDLLEILEITSEDLVHAFEDKIQEKLEIIDRKSRSFEDGTFHLKLGTSKN